MSRPATDRLKCQPPAGVLPVLQYALPAQLMIDPEYQRSIDNGPSQTLIRRIAQYWDWSLCLPLVVSRRPDTGEMFVIDGQHRLAAARLRGDIHQLPCVIVEMRARADEAAAFVHLNQQRRPLGKLDIFKAAVASGDSEAAAIVDALENAGLSIAGSTNPDSWKVGQLVNIGGIEASWRRYGEGVTRAALLVLARAFDGQVLRYAGTLFPGIAALVNDRVKLVKGGSRAWIGGDEAAMVAEMLRETPQIEWRSIIMLARSDDPNLNFARASEKVIAEAFVDLMAAFLGEDEAA